MVDKDRINELLHKFYDGRPKEFIKRMAAGDRGMSLILRMLGGAATEVFAGDIAAELDMSTPHVASELKTLERKGYIERVKSEQDKRKTAVRATDAGRAWLKKEDSKLVEMFAYLVDTVGESDMREFVRITTEINAALDKLAAFPRCGKKEA